LNFYSYITPSKTSNSRHFFPRLNLNLFPLFNHLASFIISSHGLIRQYFPKGANLRAVSREEIAFVMKRLNHRPRKTLAFKTPHDILVKSESNGFASVVLGS